MESNFSTSIALAWHVLKMSHIRYSHNPLAIVVMIATSAIAEIISALLISILLPNNQPVTAANVVLTVRNPLNVVARSPMKNRQL
jgi:hypothetical protein